MSNKTTTASARATIDAFHARVTAADKKMHELQAVQNEQDFKDKYSACNPSSLYHDLQCGHRVQTEYTASCGVLCVRPVQGKPFICMTCLTGVVRAEVALDGLSLNPLRDIDMLGVGPTEEDKVRYFANKYVAAMIKKGHRASKKTVPKLEEPLLQFFDQFMQEEGLGGLQDERVKEKVVKPRKRRPSVSSKKPARATPYSRPGNKGVPLSKWNFREPSSQVKISTPADRVLPGVDVEDVSEVTRGAAKGAMEGLTGPAAEVSVTLPSEDEATKAVGQAMEAFALI
jgi:hypothetical protein